MHTVDALEAALALAKQAGYRVREEWLGGAGGGGCEIRGSKWIFLDLALGPEEQLDHVLDTLRLDPAFSGVALPEPLGGLPGLRKSA
jgi:hypothetical protein